MSKGNSNLSGILEMEGSNLLRIKMKLALAKMNNKIKKVKKIHPKVLQALDFGPNIFIYENYKN
jgi:hypothetical protein